MSTRCTTDGTAMMSHAQSSVSTGEWGALYVTDAARAGAKTADIVIRYAVPDGDTT